MTEIYCNAVTRLQEIHGHECTAADCDWVTEEAEFEEAEYYMDTHVRLHHAPVQPTMQTTSATLPV